MGESKKKEDKQAMADGIHVVIFYFFIETFSLLSTEAALNQPALKGWAFGAPK